MRRPLPSVARLLYAFTAFGLLVGFAACCLAAALAPPDRAFAPGAAAVAFAVALCVLVARRDPP